MRNIYLIILIDYDAPQAKIAFLDKKRKKFKQLQSNSQVETHKFSKQLEPEPKNAVAY